MTICGFLLKAHCQTNDLLKWPNKVLLEYIYTFELSLKLP